MKKPTQPQGRYEIREVLGEGGMGVVYRAFDPVLKREVTLKTIRDPQDAAVLELFKRECSVLASMGHPNIVEIFDIGETEEAGFRRPYFVMPLLKGVTLDKLISSASPRLNVDRAIQMIAQMGRGLQAAHDQGLVHRDLKPANLFILEDDSVKIIDFGVAHLTDSYSATGLKGTLLYMAPEQLQMKKPTPVSDQFSMAVISYEMLTRRHPFNIPGQDDLAQNILSHTPPAASDITPSVPTAVSQVIHKALSKEPIHRFANVREYCDYLQRAFRGEQLDIFDASRVEPRLLRAEKAFAEGDWDYAGEIIRELKSESYLNPEIERLERQISDSVKARSIKQLLDTARRRFSENEHILALQKVQEVLNLDSANIDALTLRNTIENTRSTTQVEEWLHLAQQHLDNRAYGHARQAIDKVLAARPNDARAQAFLGEVERLETEFMQARAEKQKAYEFALEAFKRGDVKTALSKIEFCLKSDRTSGGSPSSEQTHAYQKLYDEVRSKRDLLDSQEAEVRKLLGDGNYDAALNICNQVLSEYPANVLFSVFRDDCEQGKRRETSAFVANVEKEVSDEADLNRKVAILEEAQRKYPAEQRFEQALKQVRARKDLVDQIVGRAQALEQADQFSDALAQWETLSNIYPLYPGLKVEVERLTRRRQQQVQMSAKSNWVTQVDQAVNIHKYERAASLVKEALAEFPGDPELTALETTVAQLSARQAELDGTIAKARSLDAIGETVPAIDLLRPAMQAAPHHQGIRGALLDLLLKHAGKLLDQDWTAAEPFVAEAAAIDPQNTLAKSLRTLIADKSQAQAIEQVLTQARSLQGEGKSKEAIRELDQGLAKYPRETRLIQLRASLGRSLSAEDREELRKQDLDELRRLEEVSEAPGNPSDLDTALQRTRLFQTRYADDKEVSTSLKAIETKLTGVGKGKAAPLATPPPAEKAADKPVEKPKAAAKAAAAAPAAPANKGASEPPKKPASGLNSKQLMYGVGALVAVALVVIGAGMFSGGSSESAKPAASATPVAVTIAGDATGLRFEDASGQDVTTLAAERGLVPGNYRVKGSRPGFVPLDVPFTIADGEQQHEIPPPTWQILPVQVVIHSTLAGTAMLDGQPLTANGTDLTGATIDGMHRLEWTGGGFGASLDFEASNGAITKTAWAVNPRYGAIFAAVDLNQAVYDAVNVGNKVLMNDAPVPASGTLELPAEGQITSLQASTGTKPVLAQLQRLGQDYSASVVLNLLPPVGGSGKARSKASPSGQTTAVPAPGPETVQAAPSVPVATPAPAAAPEAAAPKGETAADRLRRRAGATKEK